MNIPISSTRRAPVTCTSTFSSCPSTWPESISGLERTTVGPVRGVGALGQGAQRLGLRRRHPRGVGVEPAADGRRPAYVGSEVGGQVAPGVEVGHHPGQGVGHDGHRGDRSQAPLGPVRLVGVVWVVCEVTAPPAW